jgi:hypothetical protein
VTCDYCGDLDWTIRQYGTLVHKAACPHRAAPYSQTTPPDRPEPITSDQFGCARCDVADAHKGITYEPLFLPITIAGTTFTHWAPCPVNGQPILLTETPR